LFVCLFLLELLSERLFLVSNEKFPSAIKEYIEEMYNRDKNGQKFRYYTNKNKASSFPEEEQFDIEHISKIMEEVYNSLWEVNCKLDKDIELCNDHIEYNESEIRSSYY